MTRPGPTLFLEQGRSILREEAAAVAHLADTLSETFERVAQLVHDSPHHVVVSGAGKSGIIAKKIAATLASTGTPALYLHAGDAAHGDLGAVPPGAVCLLLSFSGTTREMLELATAARGLGCLLVAVTGNPSSPLATRSDLVLDIGVRSESGPHGLAPTTSTTVTLALGDALAIAVSVVRGFSDRDFARSHPGGPLGALLGVRLRDVLIVGDAAPVVSVDAPVPEVIVEIMKKRLGMTLVVEPEGEVVGIVTDGDLRRAMVRGESLFSSSAMEVMSRSPVSMNDDELGASALRLMRERRITSLLVHRRGGGYGVVTMHGLLDAGR